MEGIRGLDLVDAVAPVVVVVSWVVLFPYDCFVYSFGLIEKEKLLVVIVVWGFMVRCAGCRVNVSRGIAWWWIVRWTAAPAQPGFKSPLSVLVLSRYSPAGSQRNYRNESNERPFFFFFTDNSVAYLL